MNIGLFKFEKTARVKITKFCMLCMTSCLITMPYSVVAEEVNTRFDLLLVGGALKTCSSMAPSNCTNNIFNHKQKSTTLYQLNDKNRQKFNNTAGFINLSSKQKMQLNDIIQHIYANSSGRIVNLPQLRQLFEQANGLGLYQTLDDSVYFALLDSFEYQQLDENALRKQEVSSLSHTLNSSAIEIYQRFVQQAAIRQPSEQIKPKIAVITASSRDPFEVADFYQSIFTEAGAEVIWLPLDTTYQQARDLELKGQEGCSQLSTLRAQNNSYYREDIYPQRTALQRQFCMQPEKMLSALSQVQGVFFNGGDQSLTLSALLLVDGSDSPELNIIKQQVKAGKLIVGGTSAGTAVQAGGVTATLPVPMLTNGDSANALDRGAFANQPPSQRCMAPTACGLGMQVGDLTYRAEGGTGLFNLGLLDTHFSERDRETRLAIFSAVSRQPLAFGIDETTALLIGGKAQHNLVDLEVIGQNGVFIVDRQEHQYSRASNNSDASREHVVVAALAHYLNAGSHAQYDVVKHKLTVELAGQRLVAAQPLQVLEQGRWRDEIRTVCGTRESISWTQFNNHYQLTPTVQTLFYHEPLRGHCSYVNLPFSISN